MIDVRDPGRFPEKLELRERGGTLAVAQRRLAALEVAEGVSGQESRQADVEVEAERALLVPSSRPPASRRRLGLT